ncbi:MAG: radical SAM protein [Bacteroidales bacterium]|nr:radical SAM protein [Bacteroidales bacterium]MCR5243263.1 7-carboxy-7-deazaguanine synthase QueE [Bacteroidales bacterium]MDT3356883.1 7-carboxy-7-deazaguanine synthase QueE [Bacteroidota bacterium]
MMNKEYRINEIFYSLQGEGHWSGTPIVFVRLSGCNLRCPFCDTDFSASYPMTIEAIVDHVKSLSGDCRRICVTGGEPSLQIDDDFVKAFHDAGYTIHIETNGTRPLPKGIDWVTVSPKVDWIPGAEPVLDHADEIKVVYTGQDVSRWEKFDAGYHYLQPCSCENTKEVVTFIMSHPVWQLSLQTHKYLNIR